MNKPRTPVRKALAVAAILPLALLAGCGGTSNSSGTPSGGSSGGGSTAHGSVTIVGQGYTEMEIMSNMYADLLQKAGYSTTIKTVADRNLYGPALEKGTVDISADYASSMTEFLNEQINGANAKPVASPSIDKTMSELTKLGKQKGVEPLKPAKAQDANAFAVTKQFSQKNHVTTLSQMAAHNRPVQLAAASDCPQRDDCEKGLKQLYGMNITKFEPLGFGTTQTKNALKKGEVNLGQVGTSDGSLNTYGLVVLADDKHLENAENLVPVVNSKFLAAHQDIAPTLNKLSAVLTTADLKKLNADVDVQRQLPADVAKSYLQSKGLL